MFKQQEYINKFIKDNYKTLKIRVRKDDIILINKLKEVDNVNKYITSLILKDALNNRRYHFINNDVVIDFDLSKTMQNLVEQAEKADLYDDYGLYMNVAYAIDSQAKKETTHNQMKENEWKTLIRRYCL